MMTLIERELRENVEQTAEELPGRSAQPDEAKETKAPSWPRETGER